MRCVILVAGRGKRLRPLTDTKPKVLVEINGKPLLWYLVSALPDIVDELILVVGYKGDMIRKYCGEEFLGKKITYIEQKEPTGTGTALLLARSYITDEKFLFQYGDDIHDQKSFKECLKYDLAIVAMEHPDPRRFGVIIPKKGEQNIVGRIIEKPKNPPTNLISTGAMLLDQRIFDYQPEQHSNGEYYLTTMLDKMIKDYDIHYVITDRFISVATPEDIQRAAEELKENARSI